jgi:hypothetical protein
MSAAPTLTPASKIEDRDLDWDRVHIAHAIVYQRAGNKAGIA